MSTSVKQYSLLLSGVVYMNKFSSSDLFLHPYLLAPVAVTRLGGDRLADAEAEEEEGRALADLALGARLGAWCGGDLALGAAFILF
jgi:hypothetical protein